MKQWIIRLVIPTLLVAVFGVTVATPAQAAYSSCPSGNVCIFDGNDGTGTMWAYTGTSGGGVCINTPAANDRGQSYRNRHAKAVSFYWNANCAESSHPRWGPLASGTQGNFPCISGGHPGPCWTSANQNSSFFLHTGSS